MTKDEDIGFRELQLNANLLKMDIPDWFPRLKGRGQLEHFIAWILLIHGRAPQAVLMRAMNRTNWPFSRRIYDLKSGAQEQICWDLATTLTMTMGLDGSKTKTLTGSIQGLIGSQVGGMEWRSLARELQELIK
tara:strand:+ start:1468 stop:1866 length:399 start_codon:yes stop_codon:yes gene_type:complete